MSRAEDAFRRQPVVAAVIALHGLDIDRLPWEACEQAVGEEVSIRGGPGIPSLQLHSDGTAMVRWWRGDEGTVSLALEDDGYAIVTLERRRTPDSVLVAMTGRRLDEIVDMPGAERMTVDQAVNSSPFAGDPEDTRISVTPIGAEPVEADRGWRVWG